MPSNIRIVRKITSPTLLTFDSFENLQTRQRADDFHRGHLFFFSPTQWRGGFFKPVELVTLGKVPVASSPFRSYDMRYEPVEVAARLRFVSILDRRFSKAKFQGEPFDDTSTRRCSRLSGRRRRHSNASVRQTTERFV